MNITYDDLPDSQKDTYRIQNFDFTKNAGIKQICPVPFKTISVNGEGRGETFICACLGWLPVPVGDLLDFDCLEDIIASPRAQHIQSTMLDGSYRYCNIDVCQFGVAPVQYRNTEVPEVKLSEIVLVIDQSCNLTCPSCRTELIFYKEGPEYDRRRNLLKHMNMMIAKYEHPLKMDLVGNGDPFASKLYIEFINELEFKHPDSTVLFRTNGLFLKNRWHMVKKIERNVRDFQISIDAFSKETYEKVRRGANWEKLLENLDWLHANVDARVCLMFVVQAANLDDMALTESFLSRYPRWRVHFQKILDWGTWDGEYESQAVWKHEHPRYADMQAHVERLKPHLQRINTFELQ